MINYVIGFCKISDTWIHPLEELGYEVRLIEQTIKLMQTTNELIKPDVVAVSNKLLHALVFDCKSGKNIERDQIARYNQLTDADLLRGWETKSMRQRASDMRPATFVLRNIEAQSHRILDPFLFLASAKTGSLRLALSQSKL